MNDDFRELNELALWDFEVRSFSRADGSDEDVLLLMGSRDFCYYHNAEIRFTGVEYSALPTHFSHAFLRVATSDEVARLREQANFACGVFCIVEEHDSASARAHYVAAANVAVRVETVLYYNKPAPPAGDE